MIFNTTFSWQQIITKFSQWRFITKFRQQPSPNAKLRIIFRQWQCLTLMDTGGMVCSLENGTILRRLERQEDAVIVFNVSSPLLLLTATFAILFNNNVKCIGIAINTVWNFWSCTNIESQMKVIQIVWEERIRKYCLWVWLAEWRIEKMLSTELSYICTPFLII